MSSMEQKGKIMTSTQNNVLSDDAFARLVADDVKNKVSPERRAFLRMPENYERWQRALSALLQNLENQIDGIESDREADRDRYSAMGRAGEKLLQSADRDYDRRATKIRKFHYHVTNRFDQVVGLIEGRGELIDDEWDSAHIYRRAIREHKKLMIEADLDPTPIDVALWETLDRKWSLDAVDLDLVD